MIDFCTNPSPTSTMPLVNRYWNNQTKSVNLEALGKLARALGVSVRDLFADHEEEQ
jgi:transcriptional regulator with XRE-family HTH domain